MVSTRQLHYYPRYYFRELFILMELMCYAQVTLPGRPFYIIVFNYHVLEFVLSLRILISKGACDEYGIKIVSNFSENLHHYETDE